MINNISFKVMNKNDILAEVSIVNKELTVNIVNNIKGITPFTYKNVSIENVEDYLLSRCFDINRSDKEDILSGLELPLYDPVAIVKKTHGIMSGDYIWIKFEDNEDWNEIYERIRDIW